MKTDLSHLPVYKQDELKRIVSTLTARYEAEVEMIILFGSYARGNWVEDKSKEGNTHYSYTSDYDLLIVLSRNGLSTNDTFTITMSDKLDALDLSAPANPVFDGIDFVNKELQNGNYFFGDIIKEGILLYTSGRHELAEKQELSPLEVQAIAQQDFDHWFISANEFLEFFYLALDKEYYNKAAFELHQATERYYSAIQLVFTAYKPKTHNLVLLGRMAKICNIEFSMVFPQATHEERTRFSLLKHAYIDARYKKEYSITKDDLSYLSERVQILRNLTERICKEKIGSFT
jgi:predicted nucleotidyltransferase